MSGTVVISVISHETGVVFYRDVTKYTTIVNAAAAAAAFIESLTMNISVGGDFANIRNTRMYTDHYQISVSVGSTMPKFMLVSFYDKVDK